MRRVASAVLPLAILLLASCSDQPATQKADLQQAAEAAKRAGEAEAVQKNAPMQLGPSKQVVSSKNAATPAADTQKSQVAAKTQVVVKTQVAAVPSAVQAPRPVDVTGGQTARVAAVTTAPMTAPSIPAQPIAAGPAPSPDGNSPAVPVKIADRTPVNGTAIHLASYREIASAQRGWQILSRSYRELAPLKPLYVAVDVPGKGHVLRLYGTGADARTLKEICHEILAAGGYCADNIAF